MLLTVVSQSAMPDSCPIVHDNIDPMEVLPGLRTSSTSSFRQTGKAETAGFCQPFLLLIQASQKITPVLASPLRLLCLWHPGPIMNLLRTSGGSTSTSTTQVLPTMTSVALFLTQEAADLSWSPRKAPAVSARFLRCMPTPSLPSGCCRPLPPSLLSNGSITCQAEVCACSTLPEMRDSQGSLFGSSILNGTSLFSFYCRSLSTSTLLPLWKNKVDRAAT